MRRTISSAQTFFMKFVFPPFWIGMFGMGTCGLWLGTFHDRNGPPPEIREMGVSGRMARRHYFHSLVLRSHQASASGRRGPLCLELLVRGSDSARRGKPFHAELYVQAAHGHDSSCGVIRSSANVSFSFLSSDGFCLARIPRSLNCRLCATEQKAKDDSLETSETP